MAKHTYIPLRQRILAVLKPFARGIFQQRYQNSDIVYARGAPSGDEESRAELLTSHFKGASDMHAELATPHVPRDSQGNIPDDAVCWRPLRDVLEVLGERCSACWCHDPITKYVELRIDTRDMNCLIYATPHNAPRVGIALDRLKETIADCKRLGTHVHLDVPNGLHGTIV